MVQLNDNTGGVEFSDFRHQEEERFVASIAPQKGYPYVNLRGYTINPEALDLIPEKEAKEAGLVCFDLKQRRVFMAVKEPERPAVQSAIDKLTAKKYSVEVYMCSQLSLDHAWIRYQDLVSSKAEKKGVFEIDSGDIESMMSSIKTIDDFIKQLSIINTRANAARISDSLALIFAGAMALKASDIHIEPEENGVRLRYRFDGVLSDITDLDNYIYDRLISRLKLLSGMILNSKDTAQDGRFTFEAGEKEIEVRSSVIPGAQGESIVMRLLDPTLASFEMEHLDLNPNIKTAIERELAKPNGLIITTGPTGSGKTTALYAFLKKTHNEGVKIITIENPVEYKLEGIVQTQTDDEYTFAEGLKAILRQDPNIIMVGEIRDNDVATTAIRAAQTGHLVFTTLHTNSAAAGFPRLIDLGVDPRLMGTSINIMLGQRLVRLLCGECKESYTATGEELEVIKKVLKTHPSAPSLNEPLTLYREKGCEVCGQTGFKGRLAIFEGIIMNEKVEEVVIRDPREHIILEAAADQNIPTMVEDGIAKVISGKTSLRELRRVVELPLIETSSNTDLVSGNDDSFEAHVVK